MRATYDPYAILGVARTATTAEIGRAYRKLIINAHPDRAGAAMTHMAAEINAAHSALTAHRAAVDLDLRDTEGGDPYAPSGWRFGRGRMWVIFAVVLTIVFPIFSGNPTLCLIILAGFLLGQAAFARRWGRTPAADTFAVLRVVFWTPLRVTLEALADKISERAQS